MTFFGCTLQVLDEEGSLLHFKELHRSGSPTGWLSNALQSVATVGGSGKRICTKRDLVEFMEGRGVGIEVVGMWNRNDGLGAHHVTSEC